jgi:hypothetical protein
MVRIKQRSAISFRCYQHLWSPVQDQAQIAGQQAECLATGHEGSASLTTLVATMRAQLLDARHQRKRADEAHSALQSSCHQADVQSADRCGAAWTRLLRGQGVCYLSAQAGVAVLLIAANVAAPYSGTSTVCSLLSAQPVLRALTYASCGHHPMRVSEYISFSHP